MKEEQITLIEPFCYWVNTNFVITIMWQKGFVSVMTVKKETLLFVHFEEWLFNSKDIWKSALHVSLQCSAKLMEGLKKDITERNIDQNNVTIWRSWTWAIELGFLCTCKTPQYDVHLQYACDAWLMGGTAVGSSGSWSDMHSCPWVYTWSHTLGKAHTLVHTNSPSPPTWAGWPPKQLQLPGTDRQTD